MQGYYTVYSLQWVPTELHGTWLSCVIRIYIVCIIIQPPVATSLSHLNRTCETSNRIHDHQETNWHLASQLWRGRRQYILKTRLQWLRRVQKPRRVIHCRLLFWPFPFYAMQTFFILCVSIVQFHFDSTRVPKIMLSVKHDAVWPRLCAQAEC